MACPIRVRDPGGPARRIPHVRCARAFLPAALVGVAALAFGSLGEGATGACAGRLSCLGERLPAPITIAPGDGRNSVTFRIGRDGRIRRTRSRAPLPRNVAYLAEGVWFTLQHRHLVIGRGARMLWRSHGVIASRWQLGVVAVGSHTVAFQHDHQLYLAPLGGAERPVARRELPLGWTSAGLYTYRYRGRDLLLRSETGRLLKVIARRPLGSDYQVSSGSLYFISRGALMRVHAARVTRLASLARLGLSEAPFLQPVGRLVELLDNHRLAVVRPDGSVFAWTPLPLSHGHADTVSSSLVLAPRSTAVAFTAASAPTTETETVYLLRPGAHAALAVHREHLEFAPCERGARLEWHGNWLLYTATEGSLAVIDTSGAHTVIDLSSLAKALTATRGGFSASWSGQPPAP